MSEEAGTDPAREGGEAAGSTGSDGSGPGEGQVRFARPVSALTASWVDLDRPSAAGAYDYYLGGCSNTAADRRLAREVLERLPHARSFARENRAFLRRAVRFLVGSGIRQFLDLGSGIPTMGNVHDVAQTLAPESRVVYVDKDLVVATRAALELRGHEGVGVVQADLTDTGTVLESEPVRRLLDFREPVAVLMIASLHFVPDDQQAAATVAAYRDRMPAGSYLALSHVTGQHSPAVEDAAKLYRESRNPARVRPREVINHLLSGFEPVAPGLVLTAEWRPEHPDDVLTDPTGALAYAAVAQHTTSIESTPTTPRTS